MKAGGRERKRADVFEGEYKVEEFGRVGINGKSTNIAEERTRVKMKE